MCNNYQLKFRRIEHFCADGPDEIELRHNEDCVVTVLQNCSVGITYPNRSGRRVTSFVLGFESCQPDGKDDRWAVCITTLNSRYVFDVLGSWYDAAETVESMADEYLAYYHNMRNLFDRASARLIR